MNRWDIINAFIEKHNYKSYLEIGYYKGWSFDQIKCEDKTAVDPNPCKTRRDEAVVYGTVLGPIYDRETDELISEGHIYKLTSDDFFSVLDDTKWDIIFIDGLHEASQVEKDIKNALKHLSPKGTIVLHDCNPPKFEHTTTGIDGCWTGDTYKAFVKFRLQYPEYESFTVDTDWGCGIIITPPRPGNYIDLATEYINERIEWDHFTKWREDLLDLISVEEFKTRLNERTTDSDSTTK
jgi:hypothetical protein